MFDTIVNVEVAQIKSVIPVISAKHVGSVFGDEEAETGGEIVRLTNCC